MTGPILILIVSALLGSGVVWRHRRLLTYLAAAGALLEAAFMLLTYIHRQFFETMDTELVFWIGSLLVLAMSFRFHRHWTWPYSAPGGGRRDAVILPLLAVTLLAAWLVASRNGFQNHEWITHGFYNGDTATFLALTERSFEAGGLVDENPFAGNGFLEYPTLLHAAVAEFFSQLGAGNTVMHFLPLLTYVQILITVPLFFLLWDTVFPEPKNQAEHWFGVRSRLVVYSAQSLIVLYILALSWDTYIYPQSHFFLTGLFLMLAAVFVTAFRAKAAAKNTMVGLGLILALLLLLSNAVTGTAAVAVAAVFCLLHVLNAKEAPQRRGMFLLLTLALVAAFLIATPGQASWGRPNFSYTAAVDMLRLALPVLFLLLCASRHVGQQSFLTSASTALVALGFVAFFFSSRNIVVENASRFSYHALLVGFPLFLALLLQSFFVARRELLYTSRALHEKAALWASLAFVFLLLVMPAGASVVSTHDNLMFKDRQVVNTAMRSALWWIEDNTASDAVFIASPQPPFGIPMFTGRALLRTDYWLSPDDRLQADLVAAFAGDVAAREQIVPHADYLLLTEEERSRWEPLPVTYPVVFDSGAVTIYQLR